MSRILIMKTKQPFEEVLTKILSEESETYSVEDVEDGIQGLERIKTMITILFYVTLKCPKWMVSNYLKLLKK